MCDHGGVLAGFFFLQSGNMALPLIMSASCLNALFLSTAKFKFNINF